MRLWYQSYVDEPNGKVYWDRLRRHLSAIVDPGTIVDVKGITPHDNYAHPIGRVPLRARSDLQRGEGGAPRL